MSLNACEIVRKTANVTFGAVQKQKVCRPCRSQELLQNKPSVARIGFDIAENVHSEVWATNQPPSPPWGQINIDDNLRQLGRGSLERILLRRDGHPSLAVVLDEVT